MASVTIRGFVTYAQVKQSRSGAEYGMVGIEGITLFCSPANMPPHGEEIFGPVQINSESEGEGSSRTFRTTLNLLSWRYADGRQKQLALTPSANGQHPTANLAQAEDIPF